MMDEEAAGSIGPAFERLLQDPEAEVRTAAAGNVTAVAKHLPREMVRGVRPSTEGRLD